VVSQIDFRGDPPYALPAALGAVARKQGGLVVATFSVVVPVQGLAPVPVDVAMTPTVARLLGQMLQSMAGDAEKL
jgi:hypothetical protein